MMAAVCRAAVVVMVSLALLTPHATVVAFVSPISSSLLLASRDARFLSWSSFAQRPDSSSIAAAASAAATRPISIERRARGGTRGGKRRGVASLRAEVLPEGGVSPCVIKVRRGSISVCVCSHPFPAGFGDVFLLRFVCCCSLSCVSCCKTDLLTSSIGHRSVCFKRPKY